MRDINLNELKIRGISAVESALTEDSEVIISERGKPCYIVMQIEQYKQLREAEIYSSWQDALAAVDGGRYRVDTAARHITQLRKGSSLS